MSNISNSFDQRKAACVGVMLGVSIGLAVRNILREQKKSRIQIEERLGQGLERLNQKMDQQIEKVHRLETQNFELIKENEQLKKLVVSKVKGYAAHQYKEQNFQVLMEENRRLHDQNSNLSKQVKQLTKTNKIMQDQLIEKERL